MRTRPDKRAQTGARRTRHSWTLFATAALVACSLAPLTVPGPTQATPTAVAPVDPANGYPKWFGDSTGLRLEGCLNPDDPLCLPMSAPFSATNGPVSFPHNYPEEAFYWYGKAAMTGPNGQDALLVMAQEMAFDTGAPAVGHQKVFGRIRIRVGGLQVGTYTVTHPYGVDTFNVTDASAVRDINLTDDQGCLVTPCGDFASAKNIGRIGPFLTWTGADAPAGYVGNPSVDHAVTGSPVGTNEFRINGPGLPAAGMRTDLFKIAGKMAPPLDSDVNGVSFGGVPVGSFGSVPVGSASAENTVTLSNVQVPDLTISNAAISGAQSSDYAITTNTCTAALAQDGTCRLGVTFTPGALAARSASLDITHDQLGSRLRIPLDGRGLAPWTAPRPDVTPTSLTFGTADPQWIFKPSEPQTVTVSNAAGTAPLQVFGVSVAGPEARDFKVSNNTCTVGLVPAGGSCSLHVVFDPQDTGSAGVVIQAKNATLSISHEAAASPTEVALTGTAARGMKAVGALNTWGFPGSYTDANDVTLQPCLDLDPSFCLAQAPPFDPANGPMSLATGNFPEEAFYWSGNASIDSGGVTALLVQSQEMGFDTGAPAVGHQAVFGRLRLRVTGLGKGTYTVTHPYGRDTFKITDTSAVNDINLADDRGCLFAPCGDFSQALNTRIGPFLKWDPAVGPAAPAGHLGDPNVDHAVVGSPFGTNEFRIEGPGLPGGGLSTDQFRIAGKLAGTAPAAVPQVDVAPSSVDFGATTVVGATSASQAVTVTNVGDAPLRVRSATLVGANAGAFNIDPASTCPATLDPAASCLVSVSFAPAQEGATRATLRIPSNAVGSPIDLPLNGTALSLPTPGPSVRLSPASLDIGNQPVGSPSAAQTITVTNNGGATLNINAVTKAGANAADFAVTDTCVGQVAAGTTCSIGVVFTPSAAGARAASLSIASNAPGSPHNAGLSGAGLQPGLLLTPTSVSFANQALGTTSAVQTLTATNTGDGPMNVTGLTTGGTNAADFIVTGNTCGAGIGAGATCAISVAFAPSAPGARTASIDVASNAPGSPHSAPLSGTGSQPGLLLTPTSVNFGNQAVGTASAARAITLTNNGNAALSINGVTKAGADAADFTLTNNCGPTLPVALPAGGTCDISVTFSPSARGARISTVEIASDAPGGPFSAALTGTGLQPGPGFTPGHLSFGNQAVGTTSAVQTLTEDGPMKVTGVTPGGTAAADFTVTGTRRQVPGRPLPPAGAPAVPSPSA